MSSTLISPYDVDVTTPATTTTPSRGGRAAVAAAGFAACALPAVFTVSIVGQLVTGTESDHRFHQLTGQGLLLTALWLAGLIPVVRAGWRGVAPSVGAVYQAIAVAVAGLVAGAVAPRGGGLALAVVVAVTTAMLFAVLPARPTLRVSASDVNLLGGVITAALVVLMSVFVADQLDLQNTSHDEHAEMTHYFDMAWVSMILVLVSAFASVAPAMGRRLILACAATAYLGFTRWLITPNVDWSVTAMAVGCVGALAAAAKLRSDEIRRG